jgi:MFS family permease
MHEHVYVRVARAAAIALVLALTTLTPRPAQAQVGRAALGLIGGLAAGVHVTTGVFVLRSRVFGHDMHSTEDIVTVRPETMPIIAMPVAFALVGYRSSSRLAGAATWGGLGFVAGAAVGAGLGHILSGTSGGRWAGGTIGSAAGLALGAVLGAALLPDEDDPGDGFVAGRRYVGISIPFGPGR